ncbi:MAG: pitrilysin family protein [Candidatus Omnitrophota bacterium]
MKKPLFEKRKIAVFFLLIIVCCGCTVLFADDFNFNYHKKVLDNGASVICAYMPESPLVSIQIRVLSGLSNEGKYAGTGISHFLEHLIFKGTNDFGPLEVRDRIKELGGTINGSTGMDSAEYHIVVPNANFAAALNLIVDMVMEPVFTEESMGIERDVILKEISLRNDDPMTMRMQALFSEAYNSHIYKEPIIGDEERFKKLTSEDIRTYHSSVYTPEKMVIAVSGGIQPEKAIETARKKLSKYKRGQERFVTIYKEPEQKLEKLYRFSADVILGYMAIGFHSTDIYSPDMYAGDVLSLLLGAGQGSRLYKSLVKDKQLFYTVSSSNYTPKYPGLFVVTAIGDPDKLIEAREEIFSVIEDLKKGRISEDEMKKAKNMVISSYLHAHERSLSVASSITSSNLLIGDPAFFEKYVKEIKKIGPEEIKKIAEKYLTKKNSTTVILYPYFYKWEEMDSLKKNSERPDKAEKEPVKGEAFEAQVKVPQGDDSAKTGLGAETEDLAAKNKKDEFFREEFIELDNGLKIIVKKKGDVPLVSVTFVVTGGLKNENRRNNGISNLMSSLALKGTTLRDESQIVPAIENMGGSIASFSGMESTGLSMDVMTEYFDDGLDIFEDVVKNASFPKGEIDKQKKKIKAAIKEQEKDIFKNSIINLREMIYKEHPYAMMSLGKEATVDGISREQLTVFYNKCFVPKGAVLTIVGNVDPVKTVQKLKDRFASWENPEEEKIEKLLSVISIKENERKDITMKKEQSLFIAGFQGLEVTDKRNYTLSVIGALLSGSDGLLFQMAREKQGLAYTSGILSVSLKDKGYVLLYVATTEENLVKVEQIVLEILEKVKKGDISDKEIRLAKERLILQHAHSLETNESLSSIMAMDEFFGLGYDEYKKYVEKIKLVTKEDIIRLADQIFDLTAYATVVIHSQELNSDVTN